MPLGRRDTAGSAGTREGGAAAGGARTGRDPRLRVDLLGIYLNDHLAGATTGHQLCRRAAATHRGSTAGDTLARLAEEIAQDREELLRTMHTLGVPARRYKTVAGWVGERLGRLKLNGQLVRRSPLSSVLELEALRLGVEGKAAMWATLRGLAEHDARLDARRLDGLLRRAWRQAETLDRLRIARAGEVLTDTAA